LAYIPLTVENLPMAFKLGSLNHAKGYVINKLWEQQRYGGKHVAVIVLQKGYPPHFRHLIARGVDELRKEGVIQIVRKRTGRDFGNHAVLVKARLSRARGLLNGFRAAQNLPRLGTDLETYLPVK
jgi:hypothetical protein